MRTAIYRQHRCVIACLLVSVSSFLVSNVVHAEDEVNEFDRKVLQTLSTYCYDCHSQDDPEGGIVVDIFGPQSELETHVETVEKIIRVLKEQQMPPQDAEQMSIEERVGAMEWITARLSAFDCGSVSRPGRVTMRRLNRAEYNNTIRDLTGLELPLSEDFPSDDVGSGFDNIGDVLTLPPVLMEKYLAAAKQVADEVFKDKAAVARVLPHGTGEGLEIDAVIDVAQRNVAHLTEQAFRRPPSANEMERLFELMRFAWDSDASPQEIYKTLITAVLASPNFLYRVEEDDPEEFVDGSRPLNDFELASRLSYFLWSSMPDERLFELARKRQLHTNEQLEAEAVRMLADPKSKALVDNFAGQWLQLRSLDLLSPDPDKFSGFDPGLLMAMRQETEMLFGHVVADNRSLLDILSADYSFLNEQLADHYGIEGVSGDEFQKTQLNGKRRGVLMHGSVLLLTSNPTRTSPVKRGKWVMENLLGEPPPPPPPGVPELGESGETLGTLRQQMEQHRENPSCAVCHDKMDTLGFGLENFDAIGRWRVADGSEQIDPAGVLPGGREFSGPVDLVQILADEKKQEFARCVTRKMLTYALGRGLGVYDRCTVNTVVSRLAGDEFRFATLVRGIVTSPQFTTQESGR